jgi:diguanylate cyclase (GGDEF)-like protein
VPRSLWRRHGLALCLGVIGLGLNTAKLSLLTPQTPQYVLGGAVVLVSFVGLGTGPGLVTAIVALLPFLLQGDVAGIATLVLVAEAWGACLLYRRFGSLVFAVTVYWFTGGLVLDVLVYGGAVGISRDAVTLLFVGQVFGGILNALVAEAVLRLPGVSRWLPARDSIFASSLQQYVFNRVAFVVMIPVLALAIVSTRAAYQARMDLHEGRRQRTAEVVSRRVHVFRETASADVDDLARRLSSDRPAARASAADVTAEFLRGHPEFEDVLVIDSSGVLRSHAAADARAAERAWTQDGAVVARLLGPRPVFMTISETGVRAPGPVLAAASPLVDKDGAAAGAVVAVTNGARLLRLFQAPERQTSDRVTVFDADRRVVASDDPRFLPGTVVSDAGSGTEPRVTTLVEDAAPDPTTPTLVGASRYLTFRRASGDGWGIIVDQPAIAVQQEMTLAAGRSLGFFLLTFMLLYRMVSSFARRVSRPLLAVNAAATDIADGRFPDEAPLQALARNPIAEIRTTALHFLAMRDALAYRDALTGLPNRQLFVDRLDLAVAQARRAREGVAVFFLDLDRFRMIQDSLGHESGNALLRLVAERLRKAVREGDTIARLAADEFAFVIRGLAQAEDAARVGRKLLEALAPPFDLVGSEVFVTASLGIALFPSDGEDGEALLKNAGTAMYQAKADGRGDYRLYAPHMNDRALEQLALEGALRRAVAQQELVLFYQPLVDLASGRVEAGEALVRWRHPERGLLAASEFVTLAETSGIIGAIDSWALATACRQLREWRARDKTSLRVQVNLSARQFQEPGLVAEVARCLAESAVPAGGLEIEITEGVAIQDMARAVETLKALQALGVRISLDDFGIGYSSLSYLTTLPVNTVKLDKLFVRDVASDPTDAAIAEAVIKMCHSLDMRVVAEGVETEAQLAFLRAQGCDSVQGYLVSPPVAADAFLALNERRAAPAPAAERPPSAARRAHPTPGTA